MTKKKKRKKQNTEIKQELLTIKNKTKIFNIVSFLFILLGFLLYYNQLVTLEKLFNKVSVFANWRTLGQFIQFLNKYSHHIFDSTDKLVWWLIVSIFGLIILMEITKNWLSIFFEKIFKKERNIIIFLILFFIIMLRFYFAKGKDIAYGDGPWHLAHIWTAFKCFQAGNILPFWTNFYDNGSITVLMYSPLYPLLYGFIAFIKGTFILGVKLGFFLTHIIGSLGVYFWIKKYLSNQKVALIGSIIYGLSAEFMVIMLYPGRYPAGLIIMLVPYLYYLTELIIEESYKIKHLVFLAFLVSFIILSHFGMGIVSLFYWAIYFLLRIILHKEKINIKFKKIIVLSITGIISLLLLLFFLLPIFNSFDGWSWTAGRSDIEISTLSSKIPRLLKLLIWNNTHFSLFSKVSGQWDIGYLGIINIILALIGIYFIFKLKEKKHQALMIIFLFHIYTTFFYNFKINHIFLPLYFNTPTRLIIQTPLFITGLACIAIYFIFKRNKLNSLKLFSLLFLILLIDLGTITFQDSYGKEYQGHSIPLFKWLNKKFKPFPSYRAILLGTKIPAIFPADRQEAIFPKYSNLAVTTALIEGIPFKSDLYTRHLINHWLYNSIKNSQPISDKQLEALSSINAKIIITDKILQNNNLELIYRDKYHFVYQNKLFLPIVTGKSIEQIEKNNLLLNYFQGIQRLYLDNKLLDSNKKINLIEEFFNKLSYNYKNNSVNKIIMRNNLTPLMDKDMVSHNNNEIQILEHKMSNNEVFIKIQSSNENLIRLPYSYYPHLKITVNNKNVNKYCTFGYMIALKINKGENTIIIKPGLSPLQKRLLWFELLLIISLILALLKNKALNKKLNQFLNIEV